MRRHPGGGEPSSPAPTTHLPKQLTFVQRTIKRSVDIVAALVFFALFGPLYLAVALGVAISMGRPVHFWQVRIGEGGQRFRFYKFRSMVRDSETILDDYLSRNDAARTQWDTFQKLEKDPRITPLGKIIRKISLDELPQFWNVLKGDMSLIGPRPAWNASAASTVATGRTTAPCVRGSPGSGRSAVAIGCRTHNASSSMPITSTTGRSGSTSRFS